MIKDGDPEEVMDFYNALIAEKENQKVDYIHIPREKCKRYRVLARLR